MLMMAQRTADDHVTDARREADKLLSDARSKAEEVTREARAKADALERDARQRHQEAMGGLDAKRTALQKHIEELKQFEREYRTRLKAYLESQLRDLDGRGQGLEAEMTRTKPTVRQRRLRRPGRGRPRRFVRRCAPGSTSRAADRTEQRRRLRRLSDSDRVHTRRYWRLPDSDRAYAASLAPAGLADSDRARTRRRWRLGPGRLDRARSGVAGAYGA